MLNTESNSRIRYIDIAKGLGIIFIVIGHSGGPVDLSYILYFFHLPLFYFLSGYFWKDEYLKNLTCFINKKIKQLYIPYIKWMLSFLVIHNLLFILHIYSESVEDAGSYSFAGNVGFFAQVPYVLKDYISQFFARILLSGGSEQLLGASWFIVSLIMVFFCFTVISIFSVGKEWKRALIVFILFSIGMYLSKNKIPLEKHLDTAFIGTTFFYLGYLFNLYKEKIKFSFILFFLTTAVLLIARIKFGLIVEMGAHLYPQSIVFLLLAVSGIYTTLYLSRQIDKYELPSLSLSYIGQNTLIILFMHFIAFKLVTLLYILYKGLPIEHLARFPVYGYTKYIWIIYVIFGIAIPIMTSRAYKTVTSRYKTIT